jgi:hypothetical protein
MKVQPETKIIECGWYTELALEKRQGKIGKIVLGKSLFIGKNYPRCTCIALKKVVLTGFLKPDPNQESTGTPPTEQESIRAESRPEIF